MYPASELFRQYAEALTRSLDFQLVTAENTYTRKDFSEVAIDELISSGDELEIGSCAAARLQVTLLEGIDLPPGTELKPYIRFMGEETPGLPPNPRLVYETDTPAGTSVAAEYAVNGGAWQEVTSGGILETGGATTLAVRFRLATEDSAKTPVVTDAWLEDATGAKLDIDLLGAGQGSGELDGVELGADGARLAGSDPVEDNGWSRNSFTSGNPATGTRGWSFKPAENITLLKFRCFGEKTRNEQLSLWKASDQSLLASMTMPCTVGQWNEKALGQPIELQKDETYIIAIDLTSGQGYKRENVSDVSAEFNPKIGFIEGRVATSVQTYPGNVVEWIVGIDIAFGLPSAYESPGTYTCPIDMHGAPAPPSEWMPLGVYYVDKKPTTRQTGDYTCLDKMAQAEAGYKSELTYPAAMQDVLIEALEQIAADSAYECYDGYMVNVEPIGYTIRDILGYIASAHGGCARFDRDGLFTVTELGGEPVYTIQRKNYNSQTLERDPFQVKQIDIVVTDDLTISRGEAEPYATIQYVNPWVTEDIADVIYAQLGGLRYHDMRLDMRGLPFLEPGDTVLVEDALDPGKTFPIIVMRQKFSFSGGLTCVLESHARSYNEGNFPRTSDLQKLVDNQTKQLQEVVYHIENASVQTLSGQLTRIADINFGAIVDANPLFNAEINLHVTAPGLVEFTYVLDNAPHHVAPLQTVGEGHYIIHLFLPLLKMSGAQGHSLQVFMRSDEARGTINRYQLQATVSGTGLASVATGPPEARIIEYVPDETVAPPEYGTVTAGEIIDGTPQISMQYPVPAGAADIVTSVQVWAYQGAAVSTSVVDSGVLGHQATIIASNDGGNRIILAFDQVLDGTGYEENVDAFFVVGNESGLIKQYTKTAIVPDPQDASILYIDIAQGESLYNADGAMVTIEYRRDKGGLTLVGGIPILDFTINMGVE